MLIFDQLKSKLESDAFCRLTFILGFEPILFSFVLFISFYKIFLFISSN